MNLNNFNAIDTGVIKRKEKYYKIINYKFRKEDLLKCAEYIQKRLNAEKQNELTKNSYAKKLNRERRQRIKKTAELLQQGKTVNEIMIILNMSQTTIKNYIDSIDYCITTKLNKAKQNNPNKT